MEFHIADTFTDSLTRLTGEEQKAVKTATFDLQVNPASPGLSFHRLDKAKDKHLWSVRVGSNPFTHPDALRRFRVMNDVEELERAFTYPWEKWTIFLHPAQRELVQRDYSGPARVSGSAGTGKTIVALHRAVFLVRWNPDNRVLLTTFSETLANALRAKLRRLISNEPRLGEPWKCTRCMPSPRGFMNSISVIQRLDLQRLSEGL